MTPTGARLGSDGLYRHDFLLLGLEKRVDLLDELVVLLLQVVLGIFAAGMMSMTWLLYASTIMCACVIGWLYLQWALFFIRLDVSESIFCLFAANIVGSLMKEAML